MEVHGLLLAAGAGRRFGGPKALAHDWLSRTLAVLAAGGCRRRTVVLGDHAEQARHLVPDGVAVIVAENWRDGMSVSLRAGLRSLTDADAALVQLVDLPDVSASVVARVLAAADGPATLARASFRGAPGHPVLLGRDHWAEIAEEATGDRGARDYLEAREVELVECGDLATGRDVDERISPTS